MVPPAARSLPEDDATSPLMQRDYAERFDGSLAFEAPDKLCDDHHRIQTASLVSSCLGSGYYYFR